MNEIQRQLLQTKAHNEKIISNSINSSMDSELDITSQERDFGMITDLKTSITIKRQIENLNYFLINKVGN